MRYQTLIPYITIQAFVGAVTLLGVGPKIAYTSSPVDEVDFMHVQQAVYVVDQAAPGSGDTNAGTEAAPFKTIQQAADVVGPGDTIYVMAGKYDERVRVKSGAKGTKDFAVTAQQILWSLLPLKQTI
jgi:hypothetical protein